MVSNEVEVGEERSGTTLTRRRVFSCVWWESVQKNVVKGTMNYVEASEGAR